MSAAQRENLDAILRQSVFPAGADVSGQDAVTLMVRDVVDWPVGAP